jgi:PAS domain-containing protein
LKLPRSSKPRAQRDRRPSAGTPGRRGCAAGGFLMVLGLVASAPTLAASEGEVGQATSLALIAAGAALAFLLIVALSLSVNALLRRTRQDAREARRLSSLLDVLDEGVAVCTGMQAVAVNTSLCRLIGIAPRRPAT